VTFAAALAVIDAHLVTAGATLSDANRIVDVAAGEPGVPTGRIARYWYEGDGVPARMGGQRTLTDQMTGERVTIRLYWPVSTRDKKIAAALEADVQAAARAVKHALIGDAQLGGNCTDSEVGDADAGWLLLDSSTRRTLSVPLTLDFVDLDPIGA
jgi:hypothetical protein